MLIKNNFNIIDEIIYPDHYNYSLADLVKIKQLAKKLDAEIITTEKDFSKISKLNFENINVLKIDLKINNENILINFLKAKINE